MILILLPAYNEEESLPKLIPKLKKNLELLNDDYKIIVCNDGSKDGTLKLLNDYTKKYSIEIIHHKINRGLGETSRDLFERAAELVSDDDIIIRLDCDDTHEPDYIPTIIEKIKSGYDVVIASRFEKGGGQRGVNRYRALVSRCANIFMKVFFPIKGLKEYSCGFRGYRGSIILKAIKFYGNNFIQLKGLGFTCTLEKLVKLKLLGAKFGEIPFVLRYDQKYSESKMVSSITTLGYIVMALIYYWPWGGWRNAVKKRYQDWTLSNDQK